MNTKLIQELDLTLYYKGSSARRMLWESWNNDVQLPWFNSKIRVSYNNYLDCSNQTPSITIEELHTQGVNIIFDGVLSIRQLKNILNSLKDESQDQSKKH